MVAAYVSSRRRRSRRAAALAEQGLVATLVVRRGCACGATCRSRLFAAALTVLVVGMARPMTTVKTPQREGTVILAIDVSNSMRADDIKPTRIDAAKAAARAFVERQPPAVRIGVVAFGDGAVIVQTPTNTHADVRQVHRPPVGRKAARRWARALVASLSAIAGKPVTIDAEALASDSAQVDIGYFGSATVVLLSDGEKTGRPDPLAVAEVASVAGVHVHTIGVGTDGRHRRARSTASTWPPRWTASCSRRWPRSPTGRTTRATTPPAWRRSPRSIDLRFKIVSEHTEVTGLFSAAGAVLLLVGALLSVLWFGRVV